MKSANRSLGRTGACIRIACEGADITFITAALMVLPTRTCIAGEPRSVISEAAGTQQYSMWILESSLPETCSLEEQIVSVIEKLERSEAGLRSIREKLLSADLFCLFSTNEGQGSIELSASVLGRIANLGLELIIDVYSDSNGHAADTGE